MITHESWFAIFVRTKYERTVGQRLRDKGYQTFVPSRTVKRRWADRTKVVDVPLFPNYVFCRMDPVNRMPVVTTPDVYSIVGIGKQPTPVPDEEISAVERVVLHGEAVNGCEATIGAGDQVVVVAGPLSGVKGTVVKSNGAFRLFVTVPLLQRGVTAEISRDAVELIEPVSRSQ